MAEEKKIAAVREYLESELPGCSIEDSRDFDQGGQTFRIAFGGAMYVTIVSDEFLDKLNSTDIPESLRRFTLAEHLRELPSTPVLVTNVGLKLEYE